MRQFAAQLLHMRCAFGVIISGSGGGGNLAGKNVAHRARALELDNVRQHHRNWPSLGLKSGGPSAKVASHGVDELVMVVANAFPDD